MSYTRAKTLKNGSVRYYAAYLGADGRYHEEGGFTTDKEAAKVAARLELDASRGDWVSPVAGRTSFAEYVSTFYWPTTRHLEVSTRAAYGYYLDKHFLTRFGKIPMRRISPAMIQAWVNDVTREGLSPRSVVSHPAVLATLGRDTGRPEAEVGQRLGETTQDRWVGADVDQCVSVVGRTLRELVRSAHCRWTSCPPMSVQPSGRLSYSSSRPSQDAVCFSGIAGSTIIASTPAARRQPHAAAQRRGVPDVGHAGRRDRPREATWSRRRTSGPPAGRASRRWRRHPLA